MERTRLSKQKDQSVVFTHPSLGAFQRIETYVHFDRPLLFSCRDTLGRVYLAVASDKAGSNICWLLAPMTQQRLAGVKSGRCDLYTAYADVEGGRLLRVVHSENGVNDTYCWVESAEIADELLPVRGERLRSVLDKPGTDPHFVENVGWLDSNGWPLAAPDECPLCGVQDGNHPDWCYYGGSDAALRFPWPWVFTRPHFWQGEVMGFTGGFLDKDTPPGWMFTGTQISGWGWHAPCEGPSGEEARKLIARATAVWGSGP